VCSVFIRPFSILTLLAAVAALSCTALISANAQSAQDDSVSVSAPDERVAGRARQLEVLNRNIRRWGCDKPEYATSVAGCRQLNAQAASLAQSIDGLRGSGSQVTDEPAPETGEVESVADKKPPRLKALTYRTRTNPAGHYRTFCVKLCDGSSSPISYSTRPGGFLADDDRCQASCPSSPAKLFYAPTDQSLEQSLALDGQRYSNLPNALRYRTEFVKDCRCKPEPWSDEAKAEYERRTVVAAQSAGESAVTAGVTESAKIAAGGDIEVAEVPETRPSADRSKAWGEYRYSNADADDGAGGNRYGYGTRGAYPGGGYASRDGYYANGAYNPRSAYAQPQPQQPRRRGFFLFGSH
jgi:hypothetical protein